MSGGAVNFPPVDVKTNMLGMFSCIAALEDIDGVECVVPVGSRVTNPSFAPNLTSDYDFLVLLKCGMSPGEADENLKELLGRFAEEFNFHLEGGKHYAEAHSNFCSLRGVEYINNPFGWTVEGEDSSAIQIPATINLIVTTNTRFYGLFLTATELCKRFRLADKQKRVDLFQYVIYGKVPK